MIITGHTVRGAVIDDETRCTHYHSEIDRIAIKFYCCDMYFPCYECHEENGCDNPKVWPKEKFDEKAILCGTCGHELTVSEYLDCKSECPACSAAFNPGCGSHRNLYFES
ncbi:CHY zinc finger protein [Sporosarcina limicola]|uniref:CHY-type Zn-finger protein n=1 Tax=Sporosarcina limicola TaxID=34101 RepID=A0A927MPV5_9BACL|nr:CHY zinc finger protein [Sporosarcina limicola]MBE1555339.1 putative CHY-type Zn-finger protein [Sporosarcina limicola]